MTQIYLMLKAFSVIHRYVHHTDEHKHIMANGTTSGHSGTVSSGLEHSSELTAREGHVVHGAADSLELLPPA